MKLSEHIALFKRAIKLAIRLNKGYAYTLVLEPLISAVIPYIPIYFSAKLIDALFLGANLKSIILYATLTVGLVFLLELVKALVSSIGADKWNRIYRADEWSYSEKAMEMAYESIENRDVNLLRERIKMETQTGYNTFYLYSTIDQLIYNTVSILASVSLTFSLFFMPEIPLYMRLGLVACIFLTVACGILIERKVSHAQEEFYAGCVDVNLFDRKYHEYLDDYNAGKDIRMYNMSESFANQMTDNEMVICKLRMKTNVKRAVLTIPDLFLEDFLRFALYMVLIFAALAGSLTVGSIARYISCVFMLLGAITGITKTVQKILFNNNYLKRYFSYFDIPNNMYQGTLTVEKRDDNEYYVEFCDVSFKYPGSESYALRHVNLKFRVGDKLAVVGMNGSGKTTFIKLMCRLYDPTEGEIKLNGVNIKKYDYDEYMSIFSVVFQDFRLFSFSLAQNVAAGTEYDADRVAKCLEKAGFGDRLAEMPNSIETYLYRNFDEGGVEISGGEAQKIALARALYKNAPFIILDEPTAALDPVSEYEIYSRFNRIVGDKTVLYISHRLASCRFSDHILVFDNGQIVQQGSHDELVADEGGKYHELWNAQAQYYVSQ